MISGAAAIGPLAGGALTQWTSWHWIFLVNLPLGAIVFVAALLTVPETRGEKKRPGVEPGTVQTKILAIGPTCYQMRDGSTYRIPLSARLTNASVSSSSPGALFRTPLATDSPRGGETLGQVRGRGRTIALSHQIIDFALRGPAGSPNRIAESESLWSLIDGAFIDGDATPTPSTVGNTSPDEQRQRRPS